VSEFNEDDDEPEDVVVSLLLPESFDELPHAESANAKAATVAIAASRVLEGEEIIDDDGWCFTSGLLRESRGVTAVPGSGDL